MNDTNNSKNEGSILPLVALISALIAISLLVLFSNSFLEKQKEQEKVRLRQPTVEETYEKLTNDYNKFVEIDEAIRNKEVRRRYITRLDKHIQENGAVLLRYKRAVLLILENEHARAIKDLKEILNLKFSNPKLLILLCVASDIGQSNCNDEVDGYIPQMNKESKYYQLLEMLSEKRVGYDPSDLTSTHDYDTVAEFHLYLMLKDLLTKKDEGNAKIHLMMAMAALGEKERWQESNNNEPEIKVTYTEDSRMDEMVEYYNTLSILNENKTKVSAWDAERRESAEELMDDMIKEDLGLEYISELANNFLE